MYDELVTKVNAIDTKIPSTNGLVTKKQYDSDKQGLEKKIKMLTILMDWSRRVTTK